jgi:hypothetical protein
LDEFTGDKFEPNYEKSMRWIIMHNFEIFV